MAICIALTAEEEAVLRERAAQLGTQPEVFAGDLLRPLLSAPSGSSTPRLEPVVDAAGVFHEERWERVLASIAGGTSSAHFLPPGDLTREALYRDHD